jgi:hypothetical protein
MKTLALVSALAGLSLATPQARSADAASSSPGATQVVMLDYAEGSDLLGSRNCSFTSRPSPFAKEPATSRSKVVRGQLELGGGATNSLACLWDRTNRKLCLDLNRNGDLTDDPAGVFTGRTNGDTQVFTDVRLPLKTSSGLHSFLLNLSFYTYGPATVPYVMVNTRSYWQGQASWQGRDWQVALVEGLQEGPGRNQGSFLVLRPWAERARPISLGQGSADAVHFPNKLFWQNQGYGLSKRFQKDGDAERCRLEFSPEQPALGQLQVSGSLLNRITLEDAHGYTVFLDAFERPLRVPAGQYKVSEVWVKADGGEAVQDIGRPLTVSTNALAVLRAGGPLTNSVAVDRGGKYLRLSYRLVGADGGEYRLVNSDQRTPPQFAIYRGDKTVASGQFQFG